MTSTYLAKDRFNHSIQALAPSTSQTVAVSATSAATTNALDKNTVVVRVIPTTNCFVKIGTSTPTATTADMFMPAFTAEYFRVNGNETLKIAVIQQSASGSLYVTEMV